MSTGKPTRSFQTAAVAEKWREHLDHWVSPNLHPDWMPRKRKGSKEGGHRGPGVNLTRSPFVCPLPSFCLTYTCIHCPTSPSFRETGLLSNLVPLRVPPHLLSSNLVCPSLSQSQRSLLGTHSVFCFPFKPASSVYLLYQQSRKEANLGFKKED